MVKDQIGSEFPSVESEPIPVTTPIIVRLLPHPINLAPTVSCNTGYVKTSKRSKAGPFLQHVGKRMTLRDSDPFSPCGSVVRSR